jgi:hypothetical protein
MNQYYFLVLVLSRSTVENMSRKKRSALAARFTVVSDNPAAGEAYHHTITVDRAGRVRSVVACTEREVEVTPWPKLDTPTADDLVEVLVKFCQDGHYESKLRLLSLVVHGLLPLGNNIGKIEIPDALLDERLGFGSRASYHAEIRKDMLASLRKHPSLDWAGQVCTKGTKENREFTGQIIATLVLDPEWLIKSMRAARESEGSLFDNLVAEAAPPAARGRLAAEYPDGMSRQTICWDVYGSDFALVQEGWEERNITPIHDLAKATTWGEVRSLKLPWWLDQLVENIDSEREEESPADTAPFHVTAMGFDFGWLFECLVVPWDLESLLEWFPDEDIDIIETHCLVGGASPGGHIDTYKPRAIDSLLDALRKRGYTVQSRSFLYELIHALETLCA